MESIYRQMNEIDDKESLNEKYNVRTIKDVKKLHEKITNIRPESKDDFGFKVMFDGYEPYVHYFHGKDTKFDNLVLNSYEGIIEYVKWFHYATYETGDSYVSNPWKIQAIDAQGNILAEKTFFDLQSYKKYRKPPVVLFDGSTTHVDDTVWDGSTDTKNDLSNIEIYEQSASLLQDAATAANLVDFTIEDAGDETRFSFQYDGIHYEVDMNKEQTLVTSSEEADKIVDFLIASRSTDDSKLTESTRSQLVKKIKKDLNGANVAITTSDGNVHIHSNSTGADYDILFDKTAEVASTSSGYSKKRFTGNGTIVNGDIIDSNGTNLGPAFVGSPLTSNRYHYTIRSNDVKMPQTYDQMIAGLKADAL